jgi:hypothetical protein
LAACGQKRKKKKFFRSAGTGVSSSFDWAASPPNQMKQKSTTLPEAKEAFAVATAQSG